MLARSLPRAVVAAILIACLAAGCVRKPPLEVLFFYSAICPSCETSRKALQDAGSVSYYAQQYHDPKVEIVDVYKSAASQDALLKAIDTYQVPSEKQALPLLIVNGAAYSGFDEVEKALRSLDRRKR
jgi:hypothetical protein